MKFKIHFEWPDGTKDNFIVQGDMEAIREQIDTFAESREINKDTMWEEQL